MTRINCVPAEELTRQHLIAEYRELPRIFTLAEKRMKYAEIYDVPLSNAFAVPDSYRLGEGHVTFFYDKLAWLRERHGQLCVEMQRRGYDVNMTVAHRCWNLPTCLQKMWEVTGEAMEINRARIRERLA